MQETRVGKTPGEGTGDPLQHSCLGIPWAEGPGGLQALEGQESDTT